MTSAQPLGLAGLPPETMEELKSLLTEKAADLFGLCDQEDKGFVTKRDMQRMRGEMSLDPDQLEAVFDRLDVDGNGFLTLEEFTDGFGEYLGIEKKKEKQTNGLKKEKEEETNVVPETNVNDDDDDFNLMLSELGILGLVDDDAALRDMWLNLRSENDPALVSNFEELLSKLARDLHRKSEEQENLENVVRNRAIVQEEHVKLMYEEMEQQIGEEKQRIRAEEERREQRMREELKGTMRAKDQQLQELTGQLREMQAQLDEARKAVPDMREENSLLARERDRLRQELERQSLLKRDLEESVGSLSTRAKQERRERAMAALKVSEGIAMEREGLVRELDVVRAINTRMLDDKDMRGGGGESSNVMMMPHSSSLQRELAAGNVVEEAPPAHGGFECDDDFYYEDADSSDAAAAAAGARSRPKVRRFHSQPSCNDSVSLHEELMAGIDSGRESGGVEGEGGLGNNPLDGIGGESDGSGRGAREGTADYRRPGGGRYSSSLLIFNVREKQQQQQLHLDGATDSLSSCGDESELTSFGTRGSASPSNLLATAAAASSVNGNHLQHHHHHRALGHGHVRPYEPVNPPQRVFKIIFIGDSSVGKSSLITRFCTGKFDSGLRSTIGVDFHTRNLLVEDQSVCLQCWDTAGQERYRAITAQYFRKADAVVVVYDITSEASFLNAREWLDSAVEGAGSQASLLLLGNKVDLAQDDDLLRKVRKTEGLSLSRQYSTLFGEVSALDGRSVESSMAELSRLLREREDLDLQKALRLSMDGAEKKKKCCGGGGDSKDSKE